MSAPKNTLQIKQLPIRLGQFLKLADLVQDGLEAKIRIQNGEVMVNNLVEMSDRVLRGDIQVVARDVGTGDISLIAAAFNQALTGLRGYKEVIEQREGKK